jgi:hypothetical protein
LPLFQEETGRFKKQCEDIAQELNAAIRERNGLKQQCTAAIRQWDIALRERNEYRDALSKVRLMMMLFGISITQVCIPGAATARRGGQRSESSNGSQNEG